MSSPAISRRQQKACAEKAYGLYGMAGEKRYRDFSDLSQPHATRAFCVGRHTHGGLLADRVDLGGDLHRLQDLPEAWGVLIIASKNVQNDCNEHSVEHYHWDNISCISHDLSIDAGPRAALLILPGALNCAQQS
mmetsp:Transcript_10812/g.30665  ORF Transcript_10812/g.30665 Transcript_10812/m.30665 type:complete len:134 (+) Transcript_10812:862-1263(+)